MSKRGPGKSVAGKIIDFLRQKGGSASVSLRETADQWGCSVQAIYYSLTKLKGAGIVRVLDERQRQPDNRVRIVELALIDEHKEGDGWREVLKQKSSGGESGASPGITAGLPKQPSPVKAHTDDECLQYRITLSRDLVEVYKRLEEAQGQIVRLQDEIKAKDRKIEDLIGELEAKAGARKKDVRELASLESNLRELKIKTSSAVPAASSVRRLMIDRSGVVTLPSEGLPDTR